MDIVQQFPTVDLSDKRKLFVSCGCDLDTEGHFRGLIFNFYKEECQYELLCSYLQVHVQTILKEDYHLEEKWIPKFCSEGDPRCNIFMSPDVGTNNKLLLLVPGKKVRAGFWTQRFCFEQGLKVGTMIPWIHKALALGWAVATFNPNWNFWKAPPDTTKIPGSETPAIHMASAWNTYLSKSKATKICVLAHSKGGEYTEDLFSGAARAALGKVQAFAFTDATFSPKMDLLVKKSFTEKGRNWVCSNQEPKTNTFIRVEAMGMDNYSAGTTVHEESTGMVFEPIWEYFIEKMKD